MRTKGKIASWNDDKGYGFIAPLDGGRQVFIHVSAFSNRSRRPVPNEVVTYSLSKDKQGRPCAARATLAGDKLQEKAPNTTRKKAVLVAVLFLIATAISVLTTSLPVEVFIGYVFLSLVTFVAYAMDKSAAKSGGWRTGEGTLLAFGLAGGWPGAVFAQEWLRHKSQKTSFRAAFWVTVLLNCATFAWLHTGDGEAFLQSFLG